MVGEWESGTPGPETRTDPPAEAFPQMPEPLMAELVARVVAVLGTMNPPPAPQTNAQPTPVQVPPEEPPSHSRGAAAIPLQVPIPTPLTPAALKVPPPKEKRKSSKWDQFLGHVS